MYEETLVLKLLNAFQVTHILVDDLNLALYMREINNAKQFFMTKNPPPHTLTNKDKVRCIYLRVTQIMAMIDAYVFLESLPFSMNQ